MKQGYARRAVSILLAVFMLFSIFPIAALADDVGVQSFLLKQKKLWNNPRMASGTLNYNTRQSVLNSGKLV